MGPCAALCGVFVDGHAVATVLAGALQTGILWAALSPSWTPRVVAFFVEGPLATTACFFAMAFTAR